MLHIEYREFPDDRRFGVELELSNNLSKEEIGKCLVDFERDSGSGRKVEVTSGKEGWAFSSGNDYWHVKFDSTCGPMGKEKDSGWEVASFIGKGAEDIKHISNAAARLHDFGAQTNLNCGLHVHVETTDYCVVSMGRLLARWAKVEDCLMKMCHPSRVGNEYCKPIRTRMKRRKANYDSKRPDWFWHEMQPYSLNVHNNPEKRYAINTIGFACSIFNSCYPRNTVELRLPECVLESRHVLNWARLMVHFVDCSVEFDKLPLDVEPAKSVDEVLYYLGLGGLNPSFCDEGTEEFLVLDGDLFDLKVWFLEKLASQRGGRTAREAKKKLEFIATI